MTMPQLLDALEAEIQRVTSVEERQELGAMALLEAVRRADDEETSTATPRRTSPPWGGRHRP